MVFDLVAWGEATPGTGLQGLAAGAGDRLYVPVGDSVKPKAYTQVNSISASLLLGVYAAAVSTGEEVRLGQAGLTPDYYQFLKEMLIADIDPTQGWSHMFGRPLPVFADEYLTAYSVNATDEDIVVAALLGNEKITQNMLDAVSPTHRIHGISDTTVTAYTWSFCTVTWDQELPKGLYAIVGMRAGYYIGAAPLGAVARLVLNDVPYKPGVPCALMEADHEEFQSVTHEPYVDWPLMPRISFDNEHMPNLEVFSGSASTDENVELILQKIG